MKKALMIVHETRSDIGIIGSMLGTARYLLDIRAPRWGDELPTHLEQYVAVMVFGGAMSANDGDRLPFIRQELDGMAIALNAGKPFLGICLGAQLLARTLGATIARHPQGLSEIGYFPIRAVLAGQDHFPNFK